jgi:hypothetical protein
MTHKTQIPSSKLLPHMIHDHEVPALIANDEMAEASLARRLDKKIDREEKNKATRFILGVAAVAAAFAALGTEAVNYNRNHSTQPTPIEQTSNGYMNSGIDSSGHLVSFAGAPQSRDSGSGK